MKAIRLCDNGNLDITSKYCIENKFGIEVQGFVNPYVENKRQLIDKYKKQLSVIKGGKTFYR